jgi:1,2-diacylglycerol 3-alpha-glucosyltransferase
MIKRIGILTNTYPPIRNGVSMAVVGLEKELNKAGIETFIATPRVEGYDYPNNIFTFDAVDLPKDISPDLKLAPTYTNKVKNFFAEKEIQLIHTTDTLFGGIEGASIARSLQIPSVHTFHTMIEDYKMVSFPAYKSILRKGIKEVCNNYTHIIAPSTKVYKYLLNITVTPISHIYNIPYLNSIEFEADPKFDNINVLDDDFSFITFCRLSKEKGLDLGIKVLETILKYNPHVKYYIVGDGPERDNLIELAKSLNIESQVIMLGGYSPKNLEQIIKNTKAKVFLFTSLTENLPTNILEAMYFGLPVVAVDDESVDYLLKDQVNGYKDKLDNLFERCLKLVYSSGIVNEMSIGAKQTATEFLQKDICQQHIKLYNQLIEDYLPYTNHSRIDDLIKNSINKAKNIIKNL